MVSNYTVMQHAIRRASRTVDLNGSGRVGSQRHTMARHSIQSSASGGHGVVIIKQFPINCNLGACASISLHGRAVYEWDRLAEYAQVHLATRYMQ